MAYLRPLTLAVLLTAQFPRMKPVCTMKLENVSQQAQQILSNSKQCSGVQTNSVQSSFKRSAQHNQGESDPDPAHSRQVQWVLKKEVILIKDKLLSVWPY